MSEIRMPVEARELRVTLDRSAQLVDFTIDPRSIGANGISANSINAGGIELNRTNLIDSHHASTGEGVSFNSEATSLRLGNISRSGMFLEMQSDLALKPGASFRFSMRFQDAEDELHGLAKVRWVRTQSQSPHHPKGLGIKVVEFHDQAEKRYLEFLESCLLSQRLTDLMDPSALQVDPEDSTSTVIRRLQQHQAPCAVVTDIEGMPLGIFSRGDALRIAFAPESWSLPITAHMSLHPQMLRTDQSPEEAYATMRHGAFSHLPIVEEGIMVGLLSMRTMLRYWSEYMELQARRLTRSYDRTMSIIVHDLRTPITLIQTTNLMLSDHQVTPDEYMASGFPEVITSNCETMLSLIDDLLDRNRIQQGSIRLDRVPVAIDELIGRVVQSYAPLTLHLHIRLDKRVAPDLPIIQADPLRLEQVLNNLLSNALKFSPEQSVIQIGAKLGTDHGMGEIDIWVTDNGPGIRPEELHRLFKEFSQTSSVPLRGHAGTGLGLSIVKRLVEAHSGRIRVHSGLDLGTTFIISLPIQSLHG